jgi:hypothetical protein
MFPQSEAWILPFFPLPIPKVGFLARMVRVLDEAPSPGPQSGRISGDYFSMHV